MNELINFLTSKEIMVVYIVIALACVACFVIYLIDKSYYKRKQKHNTKELNKLVEEVNNRLEEENNEIVEETIEVAPNTQVNIEDTIDVETTAALAKEQALIDEIKTLSADEPEIENTPEIEQTSIPEIIAVTKVEPEEIETLDFEDEEIIEPLIEEKEEPNVQTVEHEEKIVYTNTEPNKEEAKEELYHLTETLAKEAKEVENIELTSYEEEQEENAIISIDELIKKSKELYEANDCEYNQYEDEGNEPISLEDLENRMKTVTNEEMIEQTVSSEVEEAPVIIEKLEEDIEEPEINETVKMDDFYTIDEEVAPFEPLPPGYQTEKKFERSPIISPIYGIERKETSEELELENTASYEKLDEEIKKTNEFLMTLKELQKNINS